LFVNFDVDWATSQLTNLLTLSFSNSARLQRLVQACYFSPVSNDTHLIPTASFLILVWTPIVFKVVNLSMSKKFALYEISLGFFKLNLRRQKQSHQTFKSN